MQEKYPTIETLFEQIKTITYQVDQLQQAGTYLTEENQKLQRENQELKEKLAKYETPKNSSNSSIPPSKDENRPRKTTSLRTSTGKKPGGQKGRKGNTLKMSSTPNFIEQSIPSTCGRCGDGLDTKGAILTGRRQIYDIPPIEMMVTEHQVYSSKCSCGHITQGDFPAHVQSPVSYGPNIEALIGYFHARQFLPFKRMQEMFRDIFQAPISEGGLHHLLGRLAKKALPTYEAIRKSIWESFVNGSDESSARVNGMLYWFWVWQNLRHTYLVCSDNRGFATVEEHFPLGFPEKVLVSDALPAQLKTPAKHYQCCLAHLQRNLKHLNELYRDNSWGNRFLKLLYDSLQVKKEMRPGDYQGEHRPKKEILKRFNKLLNRPPDKRQKELVTFYNRMKRDKEHIFTFLDFEDVPPDNNASERAIRNIKVKLKISGQFKTPQAAQKFAVLRSVIDTAIKQGENVIASLTNIALLPV
ncbi:MAG: IS66 family transposase [Cyclobacteriaceae bacterium]|nr:IS66 family transposase [Cyclobacteriaceae bacterium]